MLFLEKRFHAGLGAEQVACPRFSSLKPLLGQIHPLDQSALGPIPAVRLGTGSASLLQGVGAQCHLGKKEQAEPRTERALWEVASFRVPFTQRLAVCVEGQEHQVTFKVSDSQPDLTRGFSAAFSWAGPRGRGEQHIHWTLSSAESI